MSRLQRYKKKRVRKILIINIIAICALAVFIFYVSARGLKNNESNSSVSKQVDDTIEESTKEDTIDNTDSFSKEKAREEKVNLVIKQANTLALGYDFEGAINLLQAFTEQFGTDDTITEKLANYQHKKNSLVPFGAYSSIDQINHVFFHSLIADTHKAFDGDYDSNGYNYYMTTISEFKNMMTQMYNAGYVLVSIHDVVRKETLEDGSTRFVPGDIMLPPDKKPFVLSQDDVNYYKYMDGDGFASRIVIDENGRPTNEMVLNDGTTSFGDYDVVPVLETFIAEHPDFSYKGARGIIALTGYEGVLGYRTQNQNSPTYQQDKEAVEKVIKVLKEWGWEFASHSYGHRDMNLYNYSFLVDDTNRWQEEVGSLIGPTDLYIFPFGSDIEDQHIYDSEKYQYLKSSGFDYFFGVYKSPWMQVGKEYIRMTRRPLDGQAMLQFPERLEDLFDISKVIDKSRPPLQ
ncbi:polysaccharide deacetylase [Fredinandcohnia humi]